MDSMAERLYELSSALSDGEACDVESVLGDLLFSVVLAARLTGTDPEAALTKASDRFTERFAEAERESAEELLSPEAEKTLYGAVSEED